MMEYDIHTILDFFTLLATLWVIYIVRFQLYESYQPEQDSIHDVYVVSTSLALYPAYIRTHALTIQMEGSTLHVLPNRNLETLE